MITAGLQEAGQHRGAARTGQRQPLCGLRPSYSEATVSFLGVLSGP